MNVIILQNVGVDSEMELTYYHRDFLTGKTEVRYSDDPSKKILIHSRVRDLRSWNTKNYSLEFGVSHPHTSVDVQVNVT